MSQNKSVEDLLATFEHEYGFFSSLDAKNEAVEWLTRQIRERYNPHPHQVMVMNENI